MAIIIPGVSISDIRNKLGNLVFINGIGGLSVRERVIPQNPQSPRQQFVRNNITILAQTFRDTLSDEQVEGWSAFGKKEETKNAFNSKLPLSAIAAFIRTNLPILNVDKTIILDAPNNFSPAKTKITDISVSYDSVSSTLTMTVQYDANNPTDTQFIYTRITPSHSPKKNNVESLFRFFGLSPDNIFNVPSQQDISSDDPQYTLGVKTGDYIHAQAQILDVANGRLSDPYTRKIQVT